MANYLCSVVHGGSDPVGKSVLDFRISYFIHHESVRVRCEWEGYAARVCPSFLLRECRITQSDVTVPACSSQENKASKLNQRQSLMLHYRDGSSLEIWIHYEKQYMRDLWNASTFFLNLHHPFKLFFFKKSTTYLFSYLCYKWINIKILIN